MPRKLDQQREFRAKKRAAKLAAMSPAQRAKWESPEAKKLAEARTARLRNYWKNIPPEKKAEAERKKSEAVKAAFARMKAVPTNPEPNMSLPAPAPSPAELLAQVEAMPEPTDASEAKRSRIYWKADEITKVCANAAARMKKQGFRHTPGDRTGMAMVLDMIRAAQVETLPRERRRVGPTLNRHSLKVEFWAALDKALDAQEKPAPAPAPEPDATPISHESAPGANGHAPEIAPEPPQIAAEKLGLAQLVQLTCSRLLDFVSKTESQLAELRGYNEQLINENDALKKEMGVIQVELTNLRPAQRKKLPVVAILGCRLYEFQHIVDGAKSLGIEADFRHYDQDLSPRPFSADYSIALKWVNHSWNDQIQCAVKDREHIRFINGGIGMAVKILKEWFGYE